MECDGLVLIFTHEYCGLSGLLLTLTSSYQWNSDERGVNQGEKKDWILHLYNVNVHFDFSVISLFQ